MVGMRVANRLARGASAIMAAPDLVNLSSLLDDAKCFALVRQHRWPERVRCPGCGRDGVIRDGCDDTQPHRHSLAHGLAVALGQIIGPVPSLRHGAAARRSAPSEPPLTFR